MNNAAASSSLLPAIIFGSIASCLQTCVLAAAYASCSNMFYVYDGVVEDRGGMDSCMLDRNSLNIGSGRTDGCRKGSEELNACQEPWHNRLGYSMLLEGGRKYCNREVDLAQQIVLQYFPSLPSTYNPTNYHHC